jgi:hypothetical protein
MKLLILYFRSAYVVGTDALLIKHSVLLFLISCERDPPFAFPCDSILAFRRACQWLWCASYFDTTLLVSLPHLHVVDGISG